MEMVRSNHLILQEIFANSSVSSLKNCRLVCHQWYRLATTQMKKVARICRQFINNDYYCAYEHTALLEENESLNPDINTTSPNALAILNIFLDDDDTRQFLPYSLLYFGKINFTIQTLDNMLAQRGIFIRKLKLQMIVSSSLYWILLPKLGQLVEHMPKLQYFKLKMYFPSENEIEAINDIIHEDDVPFANINLAGQLKKVKFVNRCPKKIVKFILNLAPHVEQVDLEHEDVHYLFEQVPNKLALLKNFKLNYCFSKPLDVYIRIADQGSCLQLRKIHLNFKYCLAAPYYDPHIAVSLNRILEHSVNSVEEFVWDLPVFFPGLFIHPLLKLRKLSLGAHPTISWPCGYYPPQRDLNPIYPQLVYVRLLDDVDFSEIFFSHLKHYFKPMVGVQRVHLGNGRPYSILFKQHFQEMYPNAYIR